MGKNVSIDDFPSIVKRELEEYASMAAEDVKNVVTEVSEHTKQEIQSNAPVLTGAYKKSWKVTKTKETASSLEMTVHSDRRYRLTHLLEKGHAKRGGGRTKAIPHIAPAEANAEKELLSAIERSLK
ncbi:bacteriophage HK97-gp10 putative tail-component [Kineothrix alysoides]|uniref:Bacteriophage HK97-gp10 putative tail-component n=1 Tax=Kineothrix alysoides TaxID=1469948 RepID=A0A4R1R500_9FIRM|nr:HK97 gp10 family phage protein [Kineothrix alysoides]TCL60573.1 bacteriophage HK97-gp10 putative tail-component [Kineothrix alysoides]